MNASLLVMCKHIFLAVVLALPTRSVRLVADPQRTPDLLLGIEAHGQTISLDQENQSHEGLQSKNSSHEPAAKKECYHGEVTWNASNKVSETAENVVPLLARLGHADLYHISYAATWPEFLPGWTNNKLSGCGVAFVQVWHTLRRVSDFARLGLWTIIVSFLLLTTIVVACICYHSLREDSDDEENQNDDDHVPSSSDSSVSPRAAKRYTRAKPKAISTSRLTSAGPKSASSWGFVDPATLAQTSTK